MSRRFVPPLVVLLVPMFGGALLGCGEDSRGSSDSAVEVAASDRARERTTIRRTMKRAKREATDGSAARTCGFITAEGQGRAIQAYSLRYKKELTSCPQMVRFARRVEADYLADARQATIEQIRVRGRRALVKFEGPKIGGYGGIVDVELRKVGRRWRADDADFLPYGTGE